MVVLMRKRRGPEGCCCLLIGPVHKTVSDAVRLDLAVIMDLRTVVGKSKPKDNSEITLVLECNFECGCLIFEM